MIEQDALDMMLLEASEKMDKSLDVLKQDVVQIRAGRANPHVLDKIQVEAYGRNEPHQPNRQYFRFRRAVLSNFNVG